MTPGNKTLEGHIFQGNYDWSSKLRLQILPAAKRWGLIFPVKRVANLQLQSLYWEWNSNWTTKHVNAFQTFCMLENTFSREVRVKCANAWRGITMCLLNRSQFVKTLGIWMSKIDKKTPELYAFLNISNFVLPTDRFKWKYGEQVEPNQMERKWTYFAEVQHIYQHNFWTPQPFEFKFERMIDLQITN